MKAEKITKIKILSDDDNSMVVSKMTRMGVARGTALEFTSLKELNGFIRWLKDVKDIIKDNQ